MKWPNSAIAAAELTQALISSGQFSQAAAAIGDLERAHPQSLEPTRLRQRLLAEQRKLKEAASLQLQICKNLNASPVDWNDLAWIGLFTDMGQESLLEAARKAAGSNQSRNPEILHTLALVQASTGDLADARANAYQLLNGGVEPDAPLTVLARIAEQVSLPDVAAGYYARVRKPESNSMLSLYSFAQMRLSRLNQKLDLSN